jgi:hypothetical protein
MLMAARWYPAAGLLKIYRFMKKNQGKSMRLFFNCPYNLFFAFVPYGNYIKSRFFSGSGF